MTMRPIELENRLLSSIKAEEDLLYCQREGVTRETFIEGDEDVDNAAVYEYLCAHVQDNGGALPTAEDLQSLYGFKDTGAGDLKSYVKLARRREVGRRAISFLHANTERLGTDDPVDAIAEIAAEFSGLKAESGRAVSYIDGDAMERLEDFDRARALVKENKMIGIPTGLSTFDRQYLGFKPGELVVVMGGTGVGKSWLLMYMAAVAHKAGYRIFLVSPELTLMEQGKRFDPLRAHLEDIELSNDNIIRGQGKRSAYRGWLEELSKERRFAGADRADTGQWFTFDDIWRMAVETRPDMVIVDGLYLIGDARGGKKAGWEILKEGVDRLKALAQQESLVVLGAHQPTREASAKGATAPPDLSQIAYGFSVAQSADRVISMSYDPDSELHRLYRVAKLREGKKIPDARRLYWDVDRGKIHEVEFEEPGAFSNDFGN